MHDPSVKTFARSPEFLQGLAELASWELRSNACQTLAGQLGGKALLLFARDPELGVLLPAPGLPQVLPGAGAWKEFLGSCLRYGAFSGVAPAPDGAMTPAKGVATTDDTVAVLLDPNGTGAGLERLLPILPILGSLIRAERQIIGDSLRVRQAAELVERGNILTRALQEMRVQLVGALAEASSAREEADARATEAERLATELQAQTDQLQEQAVELEVLNQDLGERTKEAEEAKAAADDANRAKSQFLANMSHELRTPINVVIGYTELLSLGIPGPVTEGQLAQLRRISASSRHLLGLINDVLDLAKVEAGQLTVESEREKLWEVVLEAKELLVLQAEERQIVVDLECPAGEIHYVGDRDRVRQILVNLLSNAVKFTQPEGRITVRCSTAPEPVEGAELVGSGPWTRVDVEDNGIGIAPEDLGAVFKPFVQAERGHTRSRDGTGLGLTISRQLARLMGGDLTARSTVGMGSTFSLWLPAVSREVGQIDNALVIGARPRSGLASDWEEAASLLMNEALSITSAFVRRARVELPTSATQGISDSGVFSRIPVLIAEIAASLARGATVIDWVAAEQHGADRERRGWSPAAARWEFEILRQELVSALGVASMDPDLPNAEEVPRRIARLVESVCAASLTKHAEGARRDG